MAQKLISLGDICRCKISMTYIVSYIHFVSKLEACFLIKEYSHATKQSKKFAPGCISGHSWLAVPVYGHFCRKACQCENYISTLFYTYGMCHKWFLAEHIYSIRLIFVSVLLLLPTFSFPPHSSFSSFSFPFAQFCQITCKQMC